MTARKPVGMPALLLASAAVIILLGMAGHGHHDACHDVCWLCYSAASALGLPATFFLWVMLWIVQTRLPAATIVQTADATLRPADPRAPPV